MNGLSVLTLVRNREAHLLKLIEGLRRSHTQPDELIVVDMSDEPLTLGNQGTSANFPIRIDRLETAGLPLAQARNRAATLARFDRLIFLDVDCIPLAACIGRLAAEMERQDALFCADIRYLGPDDARGTWTDSELLMRGEPHPVRAFPTDGVREESNPGLFWSLAFAIRQERFVALGGFDEGYQGYGAEDTDFGFRAAEVGLPLMFVGGAIACHQHHASHEPPVQHLADIVGNARRFHRRWGRWPMEGWLTAFRSMGLVAWTDDSLTMLRHPTAQDLASTRVHQTSDADSLV